jgi:hypothetical protein
MIEIRKIVTGNTPRSLSVIEPIECLSGILPEGWLVQETAACILPLACAFVLRTAWREFSARLFLLNPRWGGRSAEDTRIRRRGPQLGSQKSEARSHVTIKQTSREPTKPRLRLPFALMISLSR